MSPAAGPASGARLTAIVPIKHYAERYLREAFASLLQQTSPRWQAVVVVEPADRVLFARLLAAELRDPRITMVANEGRQLGGAINTAIRHGRTDFVAILLADDLWASEAVEVLARNMDAHPDVDFFHSARRAIDDDGQSCSGVMPASPRVEPAMFAGTSPVKHLLCFRRETALAVGGLDESLNSVGPDDYDFPWTMADHGARFRAVPECLYVYRDHRQTYRLTTHLTLSHHSRELVRIMRKHGVPWWTTLARVRAARRGYLRQCLYRNALDKWVHERFGLAPRRIWRERYP
jgi:glycosyltransferase involved in cell wall biosynthesis